MCFLNLANVKFIFLSHCFVSLCCWDRRHVSLAGKAKSYLPKSAAYRQLLQVAETKAAQGTPVTSLTFPSGLTPAWNQRSQQQRFQEHHQHQASCQNGFKPLHSEKTDHEPCLCNPSVNLCLKSLWPHEDKENS